MRRLFLAALLYLSPVVGYSLTLAEIETQVRYNVHDTGEVGRQIYTDAVLDTIINEVQREINSMTWAVEASSSITTVASTAFYALPTNLIAPVRVTYTDSASVITSLMEESERSVIENMPDFQRNSVGKPTRYFIRQKKTSGATQLEAGLIPLPNSSSTGTLTMDYVVQTTDLSSDSDIPFNGLRYLYPYHMTIVYGVTLRLKLIESKADEAEAYASLFDRNVQVMKDNIGRMPNFHPSASPGTTK